LRLIESELNRLIGESTAARHRLAELAGTSFAVHVEGLGLTVVLHSDGERIRVDGEATTATATLRATPLDLLHLARAEGAGAVKRTKASLTGDLQVAERYAELLKLARPDLEGEAANWVGDVPAHALGTALRGATAWLASAGTALRMNTAEYLQEESRAVPAPLEADAFYAEVENLRDDVERAAARLARLERR
jgi:ubiquinone biosynthesis protein UbiJ